MTDEEYAEFLQFQEAKRRHAAQQTVQERQPAPQTYSEPRTEIRRDRRAKRDLLTEIAPSWALDAENWVRQQPDSAWRGIALVTGIIVFIASSVFLFGGGYTSIQGVRIPLSVLGLPVATIGIPPWYWWLLPLACTFVELLVKHIRGLRALWRPVIVYDGTTTAIFVALSLIRLSGTLQRPLNLPLIAAISAVIGLLVAVLAEKLFLASICIIRASRARG